MRATGTCHATYATTTLHATRWYRGELSPSVRSACHRCPLHPSEPHLSIYKLAVQELVRAASRGGARDLLAHANASRWADTDTSRLHGGVAATTFRIPGERCGPGGHRSPKYRRRLRSKSRAADSTEEAVPGQPGQPPNVDVASRSGRSASSRAGMIGRAFGQNLVQSALQTSRT